MTIARKRIGRLTLVAVVLTFVLGGMGCGDEDLPFGSIHVAVAVTKDGDGTGGVTSSVIRTRTGGVILDCEESELIQPFSSPAGCKVDFVDSDGSGTLFLTATPDPGSVVSGWDGCTSTPADDRCALSFNSPGTDVDFLVTVTFDLSTSPPPSAPKT